MKTLTTSIILLLSSITLTFSQDFTPGYYIIEPQAQYVILIPSGVDFELDESKDCYVNPGTSNLYMAVGEVVLAFDYSGGKVYCFDPNGRMIIFNSLSSLSKAPIIQSSGIVGKMSKEKTFIDGSSLGKGSYVWIIGEDVSKSTRKIQIHGGKTYELPEDYIEVYSSEIKKAVKIQTMRTVE